MRRSILIFSLLAAACAMPASVSQTTMALTAADASTSLLVGETVSAVWTTPTGTPEGEDPVVTLTLQHADGRRMSFQEANHAQTDLMAQAPGGPLAQIMGLFGEEQPTLYSAVQGEGAGAPFLCSPEGPAAVGMYQAADGTVQVVGLKQAIQFDQRPDGSFEAAPYSPDHVCARLRFHRS
jgi:hypothetical protein